MLLVPLSMHANSKKAMLIYKYKFPWRLYERMYSDRI